MPWYNPVTRKKAQDFLVALSKPFPAAKEKGAMDRDLAERYGHARETNSLEPTADAKRQGASNAGQDASSGCETISADPTRFPREGETEI
jgi:hypothetical protein